MNKKLALKISKHPLIKKLMEDRTISKNVIANLIVEEIIQEEYTTNLANLKTQIEKINNDEINNLFNQYIEISKRNEIPNKEGIISNLLFMANKNKTKSLIDKLKYIIGQFSEKQEEPAEEKIKTAIDSAKSTEELEKINKQVQDSNVSDETKEKTEKAAEEKEKQFLGQQENPYSKLEGYKELNLKPEEQTVFISFLDKLKEKNIIKENSTKLAKMIGTGRGLNDIIKSFEGDNRKILYSLLNREEVLAFIQKNIIQINKEPESDDSKDTPTAGSQLPIDEENVGPFIKASDNFLKEFYRQKYKKTQAEFIKNVIDSLSGMVEDENLAQAVQRVPDKKEETEQEKPELVSEQEEQKQASKDEMKNLRIGMNSLLKRINWSQKSLEAYEKTAGSGSVLADADKKKFIKVLQDIQKSIRRICLVLQQILRDTQTINEEESDTVKQWREIQKKYDLASEAVSNLAELLKPGGVKEIPKMLTNDAFSALIDLSIHFPSVAPFGAGKDSRRNFKEYQVKFKNAVQKVKDDLQNVFSIMKTGQAGEESLILALDGLKEFSAHIQSIFGIPSEFEELKIEPNEEAAEGEPKAQKKKSYGDVLTDKVLSFLGNLISKGRNKRDIQRDIEKQESLDERQKEILSSIVERFRLNKIQQEANMTSGEMQLYIQLLIALEGKGIVKLNEAVIPDDIQAVIKDKFSDNEEQIIAILKKPGVLPHLLSISTDNFGEEGYETFDDEETDDDEETNDEPRGQQDYKYFSNEEEGLIEYDYTKQIRTQFEKELTKATKKYVEEDGRPEDSTRIMTQGMIRALASLKMANQKQKTASEEENIEALENIKIADLKITDENVDNALLNFKQFLGDSSEYEDYEGSKKILAGVLGAGLFNLFSRYNPIIPFIDDETMKSIKEYINDNSESISPEEETAPEQGSGEEENEEENVDVKKAKEVIRHIEEHAESPDFSEVLDDKEYIRDANGKKIIGASYYKIEFDDLETTPEKISYFGKDVLGNENTKKKIFNYLYEEAEEDTVLIFQKGNVTVVTASEALKLKSLKQSTQEQIANKLKPLIREMLNKGK